MANKKTQESEVEREEEAIHNTGENELGDANDPNADLTDWQIEHNKRGRKAHPGPDHFVGNAAAPVHNPPPDQPQDETRSHGNRPKGSNAGRLDHN